MSKIDWEKLKAPIPIDRLEFKPGKIFKMKGKPYAIMLAYKDARVDLDRLDEVVGPGNWQDEFFRDSKGDLQCRISIKTDGEWVTKGDVGTPSDFEKTKGEYSDARKRAGFVWNIGRELYSFPILFVELTQDEVYEDKGVLKGSAKLRPNDWTWTKDGDTIMAVDKDGVVRVGSKPKPPKPQVPQKATSKPAPTTSQWKQLVDKVKAKETTIDQVKEHFSLTSSQEDTLKLF